MVVEKNALQKVRQMDKPYFIGPFWQSWVPNKSKSNICKKTFPKVKNWIQCSWVISLFMMQILSIFNKFVVNGQWFFDKTSGIPAGILSKYGLLKYHNFPKVSLQKFQFPHDWQVYRSSWIKHLPSKGFHLPMRSLDLSLSPSF